MTQTKDPVFLDIINRQSAITNTRDQADNSREVYNNNSQPREVYKDKNIKRYKDNSRNCEEVDRTCPSDPTGRETSFPNTRPEVLPDPKGVSVQPAAATTSRVYSGISVQHAKTDRGTKLFITLQTPEDAADGVWLELTAELKHKTRLREVKRIEYDSDWFDDVIQTAKQYCQDQTSDWYLGRIHNRSKRSAWFQNTLVMAHKQANAAAWKDNVVDTVILILGDERYDIAMTQPLNANQQQYYNSSGYWGKLEKRNAIPTLATAQRTKAK